MFVAIPYLNTRSLSSGHVQPSALPSPGLTPLHPCPPRRPLPTSFLPWQFFFTPLLHVYPRRGLSSELLTAAVSFNSCSEFQGMKRGPLEEGEIPTHLTA